MKSFMFIWTATIAIGLFVEACNRSGETNATARQDSPPPEVLGGGTEIKFADFSPQLKQFSIDTVRQEVVRTEFSAPAHLAASIVASEFGNNKIYLFESQDLAQLYSDFKSSMAAVERSTKNVKRLQELAADKAVSEKELLDAQTDFRQSQAALAQKESQLRAACLDPSALDQAPVGTVVAIAEIPEDQLTGVKPSTRADLQCNAYAREQFAGRVSAMGDVVDPVTRTVKVRIILANPSNKLRAGMYGTAHFDSGDQKVIAVPTTGVVRESDGSMTAWVTIDRHKFVQRKVRLGIQTDSRYEIVEGLRPGELLVSRGGIFLSNMLQAIPND